MHGLKAGGEIVALLEQLRVDPLDVDLHPVGEAAMVERFIERFIRVEQADIFADHANRHFPFGVELAIHDVDPAIELGRGRVADAEGAQHFAVQPFGMILFGDGVDALGVARGNDGFGPDIAEQRDLLPLAFGQRMLAAAQQDVGLNAERRQIAHAALGRLGLQLAGGRDIGHQRHMDEDRLAAIQIIMQLANRFHEGQRFDVADRAADFAQNEVQILGIRRRERLDLIGDVRDHLHRRAQIVAAPFALDDRLIDAALRHIVRLARRHAGESLIMAKVEIGFRPVVGHIDFAMLIGAHRARIDVEIGVEFPDSHTETSRLQQRCERSGHQALAKRGDHAAGDENIPRHGRRGLAFRNNKGQARESTRA